MMHPEKTLHREGDPGWALRAQQVFAGHLHSTPGHLSHPPWSENIQGAVRGVAVLGVPNDDGHFAVHADGNVGGIRYCLDRFQLRKPNGTSYLIGCSCQSE
ncbi:unnamed protein product [Nezara viridula]|uniref:Uncharacterized protein n=1 Tax=Nezara viridula TaxID=85310 RepID=A0A9P0HAG1_NEZVI|nr:unnamed protein product [Nezara viridula]